MGERRLVERVWWGSDAAARVTRAALMPASAVFRMIAGVRNALYDSGVARSHVLALPAISVGNLSVGGTGKTPVAAWLASRAQALGGSPAVVLRGYGGDEPDVHARLNPGIPVVAGADRVAATHRARSLGADIVVLDDAFQHRRARRDADVVLVSAERWTGRTPLLPRGPWREPLGSLARADLVLVTRKSASSTRAYEVAGEIERRVTDAEVGVVALMPGELRLADGSAMRPLEALRDAAVLAIAAIGDPAAFLRQLESVGARVDSALYVDHHAYSAQDAGELARRGARADLVVCTLKDVVKLGPHWPRQAPPLWYVSQRVLVERGAEALTALIGKVMDARARHGQSTTSSRQVDRSHEH